MNRASQFAARAFHNPNLHEDAVLLRRAAGSWSEGRFVQGVVTRVPVKLVQAPVQPQVRETLPEGQRDEQLLTFYLRESVTVTREGSDTGDSIEYGGQVYDAVFLHNWGGFNEVIGALQ